MTTTNKMTKKQQCVFEAKQFLSGALYSRYIFNEQAAEAYAAGNKAEATRLSEYSEQENGKYMGYIEALNLFMTEAEVNEIITDAMDFATVSVKTHVDYKNRETA